jgi:hypothetical protein
MSGLLHFYSFTPYLYIFFPHFIRTKYIALVANPLRKHIFTQNTVARLSSTAAPASKAEYAPPAMKPGQSGL